MLSPLGVKTYCLSKKISKRHVNFKELSKMSKLCYIDQFKVFT